MSWGQSAGEGASAAGGASSAGGATSMTGQIADAGGSTSPSAGVQPVQPTSGFGMQTEGANTGQGPTVDAANVQTYGTKDPSVMQQGANYLERFQKGSGQGLTDTYKNFGNNPETYGAAYGLATKMAGSGKPSSGAPITTNISYQQPDNPYLRKRGRY